MNQYDLIIVGAGIHGAALAYYSARAGQRVMLIDEARPASGASGHAFGWINASALIQPVQHLAQSVIDDYHHLQAALPAFPLRWCAELTYGLGLENLQASAAGLSLSSLQPRTVSQSEILALEPNLAAPPLQARYTQAAGVISPVEAIECLVWPLKVLAHGLFATAQCASCWLKMARLSASIPRQAIGMAIKRYWLRAWECLIF